MTTLKTALKKLAYQNPRIRRHVAKVLPHVDKEASRAPLGDTEAPFGEARAGVAQFFAYMKDLRKITDNLTDLIKAAEAGRGQRSRGVVVQDYNWDGINVNGTVLGTSGKYNTHLTLNGNKWGASCSCPDAQHRQGDVGPCKHAYALGREFWEAVSEELEDIEDAVYTLEASCRLLK